MFYTWGGVLPPIVVSVFAGQISLSSTERSIYGNASKIITHENFNKITFANDIAIIEVSSHNQFFFARNANKKFFTAWKGITFI